MSKSVHYRGKAAEVINSLNSNFEFPKRNIPLERVYESKLSESLSRNLPCKGLKILRSAGPWPTSAGSEQRRSDSVLI